MQNDLISRSALLEKFAGESIMLRQIRQFIHIAPAVDAVVIPCKIGDTVWAIRRLSGGNLRAMQGVVSEMQFIGSEMRLSITIRNRCRGEWGETIFATKEDAEAEIARRRADHGAQMGG